MFVSLTDYGIICISIGKEYKILKDRIKVIVHHVTPKYLLTLFAGRLANLTIAPIKNHIINRFIKKYQVDMSEALEEDYSKYRSFNDFFIRQLKACLRPLSARTITAPVDGVISQFGAIVKGQLVQAKGHHYTMSGLLAHDSLSIKFENGAFATFYLSPKDYHRIHMPITGTLRKMIYVPGKLFSVQPLTVNGIPNLFARNERLIAFFDTELGLMAMVLVGATIVGSIATQWHGEFKRQGSIQCFDYPHGVTLIKGQEMGYFKLGSTVIMVFANGNQISWDEGIEEGATIRYGEPISSD